MARPSCDLKINPDSDQAQGLVGWWPAQQRGLGNDTIKDLSGSDMNAPATDVTQEQDPEFGTVDVYNGETSIADLSDPSYYPKHRLDDQITITQWVWLDIDRWRAAPPPAIGDDFYYEILAKGRFNESDRIFLTNFAWAHFGEGFDPETLLNWRMVLRNNASLQKKTEYNIWPEIEKYEKQWVHYAATWSGIPGPNEVIKLYVNGLFVEPNINPPENAPFTQLDQTDTAVWMGARWAGSSVNAFEHFLDGKLADVRLYNVEKTAEQIAAMVDPITRWDLYASPNRWISDWQMRLDDMHDYDQWGERVAWLCKSTGETKFVPAIIQRNSRMSRDIGEQYELVAIGNVKVRICDVPDAQEHDTVVVPISFQSEETERWVATNRTDLDNGEVAFDCMLFDDRRYRTRGIERAERF